jgi:hypothetical protein
MKMPAAAERKLLLPLHESSCYYHLPCMKFVIYCCLLQQSSVRLLLQPSQPLLPLRIAVATTNTDAVPIAVTDVTAVADSVAVDVEVDIAAAIFVTGTRADGNPSN